jgi:aryl-phospho-beta-D-glucosidase BglC (GH1 family)
VAGATKKHWNVFAVDLKNEPFGVATWGDSHPATDWNKAAVDIAKHLLTKHSEWTGLIFVEGKQHTAHTHTHKYIICMVEHRGSLLQNVHSDVYV